MKNGRTYATTEVTEETSVPLTFEFLEFYKEPPTLFLPSGGRVRRG
jgi:hypothetical protein